jgi:hypothetical protein
LDIEKAVLKNEIAPQIKDIIKLGLLNEKNNTYLLVEKIIALFLQYQPKYFGIKDKRNLSKLFPITFDKIEYNLRYEKAYRYYEHKCHFSRSPEDLAYIKRNAEIAAKNKLDIGSEIRYLDFERVEKIFLEAIHNLREQGINSIDELILPEKNKFSSSGWVWDEYSDDRLIEYVLKVYQLYLEEYQKIIETNFGYLREQFKLYSMMPLKCFIALKRGSQHCGVNIDICHNKDTEKNEVISVDQNEIILDHENWKIHYLGEKIDLIHSYWTDISHFFGGVMHLNVRISSELTPIRSLVYQKINSEIKGVINYLFNKYQVARE